MAVIPKVWGTAVVAYQTDAFSGADSDVSTETELAVIDFVSGGSGVDCSGQHGVSLKFKVNSSGTTDNFVVRLYASEDGAEEDTVILSEITFSATGGGDVIATLLVPAPARHLHVKGLRSGSTNTFDVEVTVTPFVFGA